MIILPKSTRISVIIVLLVSLAFAGCERKTEFQRQPAIKPPTKITGKITFLIGESMVKRDGSSTWTRAEVGMTLAGGDQVRTGESSTMDMLLFENAAVRIKDNTTVTLSQLITSAGDRRADMDISIGRVYTFLKKVGDKASYVNLRTPNAVAAIRGTRSMMEFSPVRTTRIEVLEGNLSVINRGNVDDQFTVGDGQKVELFHRGLRDSVTVLSEKDLKRLEETSLIHFAAEEESAERKGTENITEALDIYKKLNGIYPAKLEELPAWGIIDKKFLRDQWGSDYTYMLTGKGAGYSLRSIGADHISETPDDIIMSR